MTTSKSEHTQAMKERSDRARERLAALDRNAAVDLAKPASLRRKPAAETKAAEAQTPRTSPRRAAKGKRRADDRLEDKA